MGSAASGQVTDIQIEKNRSYVKKGQAAPSESSEINLNKVKDSREFVANGNAKLKEAQIGELQQKVFTMEAENLNLKETVNSLETKLKLLQDQSSQDNGTDCSETLRLKDRCIARLEKETSQIQAETLKLKTKYRKKLRMALSELATSKQDNSLRVFELKDEISKLMEENAHLQQFQQADISSKKFARSRHPANNGDAAAADPDSPDSSARTDVILALSQQISEQNAKICALEEQLSMRERPSAKKAGSDESAGRYSKLNTRKASHHTKSGHIGRSSERSLNTTDTLQNDAMERYDNEWPSDLALSQDERKYMTDKPNSAMGSLEAVCSRHSSYEEAGSSSQSPVFESQQLSNLAATCSRQSSALSKDSGWEELAVTCALTSALLSASKKEVASSLNEYTDYTVSAMRQLSPRVTASYSAAAAHLIS